MDNLQLINKNRDEIERINDNLNVRSNINLQNEMDYFVQKMAILCGIEITVNQLNAISLEIVNYLKKYEKNVTFNEFCKIVNRGILQMEYVSKFSIQLFTGTFEKFMSENRHFKSKSQIDLPNDYFFEKKDTRSILKEYWEKFLNGTLSEIEIEYSLPTVYDYMKKRGHCNFSEEQKKIILVDMYISPEQAQEALRLIDRKKMIQFQKNKGYLVLEQFKITKENEKI